MAGGGEGGCYNLFIIAVSSCFPCLAAAAGPQRSLSLLGAGIGFPRPRGGSSAPSLPQRQPAAFVPARGRKGTALGRREERSGLHQCRGAGGVLVPPISSRGAPCARVGGAAAACARSCVPPILGCSSHEHLLSLPQLLPGSARSDPSGKASALTSEQLPTPEEGAARGRHCWGVKEGRWGGGGMPHARCPTEGCCQEGGEGSCPLHVARPLGMSTSKVQDLGSVLESTIFYLFIYFFV